MRAAVMVAGLSLMACGGIVYEGSGGGGGGGRRAARSDGGGAASDSGAGDAPAPLWYQCGGSTCPEGYTPYTVKATTLCGGSCGVPGIGYLLICSADSLAMAGVSGACAEACTGAILGQVPACVCDGGAFYVCGG